MKTNQVGKSHSCFTIVIEVFISRGSIDSLVS
jgi:hypothetical protein